MSFHENLRTLRLARGLTQPMLAEKAGIYEIKGGKIVGMLKDVAYQMRTPDFWASLDMIGGPKSYFLGGAFGDAKGQPVQVNAISHGAPVTRFRNINVINTGRSA